MNKLFQLISQLACIFFAGYLAAQPANDNCETAIFLNETKNWCSATGQFTTAGATVSAYNAAGCFASNGRDVWFTFVATATNATITVVGNTRSQPGGTLTRPEIALYTGECGGTINEVGCVSDNSNNIIELSRGGLVAGQTYLIRVQGRGTATGTFQLCVNNFNPPVLPGSDCNTASILCDKSGFVVQKVEGAGTDPDEARGTCLGVGTGNSEQSSTWFVWTAATAGSLTFTIQPINRSDDIDFVVFELPNGPNNCSGKVAVRCMATACLGPTGLNTTSTDLVEDLDCNFGEDGFVRALTMQAGRSYGLLINNFSQSGNGFSIDFGGTGTFLGPQADFTVAQAAPQDNKICRRENITFEDASQFANGTITKWTWNFGVGANPATATGNGPHTVVYNGAGTKSITLIIETDAGCQITTIKNIEVECCTDSQNNSVSGAVNTISCNGQADGAVDLTVTTAFPPARFEWSNGARTEDITGLGPGTYNVTVTDAGNCPVGTGQFPVTEPTALRIDTNLVLPGCGLSDGAIEITASGGTSPYTYQRTGQPASSNPILGSLPAGPYPGGGTDAHGCQQKFLAVLPEKTLVQNTNATVTEDPACNGENTGSINIALSNGTSPFQFTWNDGTNNSNNLRSSLPAGAYSVSVTDGNGCKGSFSFTLDEPPVLALQLTPVQASCEGARDGQVNTNTSGGTAPYTFLWSNGSTAVNLNDLPGGIYAVTVTDANGCTTSGNAEVINPPSITASLTGVTDALCFGQASGTAQLAAMGGTPPYSYSADGINYVTNATLQNLAAGSYVLPVRDAEECRDTVHAVIDEPEAIVAAAFGDTTVELGSFAPLLVTTNADTSGLLYEWTPAESLSCSDCAAPLARPGVLTTYTAKITNAGGCTVEAQVTVDVTITRSVFIPSAFSPGGKSDETNDKFRVFGGQSVEVIQSIRVFDRWGGLIYQALNMPPDGSEGWDGMVNGQEAPTGVYVYFTEVKFLDGEVLIYEGDVTLLR